MIDYLTTGELWNIVEDAFNRRKNITSGEEHLNISTKNLRKIFLQKNMILKTKKETLIRYVFIANLVGLQIKKELIKQAVEF